MAQSYDDAKCAISMSLSMALTPADPYKSEASLFQRARPDEYAESFFNHHLKVANALGMTWEQALIYIADKRVENGRSVIAVLLTQMAY